MGHLYLVLRSCCPPELEVFLAPTDYQPTSTRSLQPDLLVVRRDDPGDGAVTTPLSLAVEVLSPSSRSVDQVLKRELYEQAGVAAYWVVDPLVPSVTVWLLEDGHYGDPLVAVGPAVLSLDQPFPVRLAPSELT